jgi:hypothetical protein
VLDGLFDKMSPLGFGIWYLDDGNLTRPTPRGDKLTVRLSSCAFTEEENLALRALLEKRVAVTTTRCTWRNPREPNTPYIGIRMYAGDAARFLDFVRPALQGSGLEHKLT